MRIHNSIPGFALVLALAAPLTVIAADRADGEGDSNWVEHLGEGTSDRPAQNTVRGAHLGTAAPAGAANRKILITDRTTYANVKRGDVVTFQNGDKSFTWKFDTLRATTNFRLAEITPKDFGTGHVRVYVNEVNER